MLDTNPSRCCTQRITMLEVAERMLFNIIVVNKLSNSCAAARNAFC